MIGERIVLRKIENLSSVAVIVVRPIRHGAERGTRTEVLGLSEERHQRHEAAVTAAVHANALRVHAVVRREILRAIHFILQIATTHEPVDRRAPVAAIARAPAVVHVQHGVPLRREVVIKHVLTRIGALPVVMNVVHIAGPVHKNHRRTIRPHTEIGRLVNVRWHLHTIRRRDHHQLGIPPVVRQKVGRR